MVKENEILKSKDISRIISDCSEKIFRDVGNSEFAVIGIQTRGVELADRIKNKIESLKDSIVENGILDITFYRDDLSTRGYLPVIKETKIEFDITGKTIILVDDVIFTGRTIKAALETLMSFGRPRAIKLFVLVDRGNRELPIHPDYCGFSIKTGIDDEIKVRLIETDNVEDSVVLCKKGE